MNTETASSQKRKIDAANTKSERPSVWKWQDSPDRDSSRQQEQETMGIIVSEEGNTGQETTEMSIPEKGDTSQ